MMISTDNKNTEAWFNSVVIIICGTFCLNSAKRIAIKKAKDNIVIAILKSIHQFDKINIKFYKEPEKL